MQYFILKDGNEVTVTVGDNGSVNLSEYNHEEQTLVYTAVPVSPAYANFWKSDDIFIEDPADKKLREVNL